MIHNDSILVCFIVAAENRFVLKIFSGSLHVLHMLQFILRHHKRCFVIYEQVPRVLAETRQEKYFE